MDRRISGLLGASLCAVSSLFGVSGCNSKSAGPAPVTVQPVPPANLPPAVQQRRAAEAQGRAEDAKRAASSAGAKLRQ